MNHDKKDELSTPLLTEAELVFQLQVEEETPGLMTEAERYFVLSQTDRLWKEHLQALKFLQQAVGLRGYAQRDPLVEYKLEGYNLFLELMAQIRRNVIYSVYQVLLPCLSRICSGNTLMWGVFLSWAEFSVFLTLIQKNMLVAENLVGKLVGSCPSIISSFYRFDNQVVLG